LITNIFEERKRNPEIHKGDFLDEILADMKTETFLTDKFIIYMMFGLLLASFETISSTLTLAIKLIGEHPKVVQELTVSDTNMCQILLELGLKNVFFFFFLCVCVCV
jgi:cytochrome P450